MFRLSESAIISTTIEALLLGFSVFMFILTMWILLRNRHRRRLNYCMIVAACSLQILATAELIVNILRVWQGFLTIGPRLPATDGPEEYFTDVTQPTFIIKSCLYNTQTLILDGVVIYRTYVVWQNAYIVVLPVLGWLALLASSIKLNVAFAMAADHANDVFAAQTARWITSTYSLTLVTNLTATTLLATRIWKANRLASRYQSGSRLAPILRIVVESGVIYSLTIIAALITFVLNSNGIYVLLDMISPIICIVFNMIIVRVGLASDRRFLGVGTALQPNSVIGREDHGRLHAYATRSGYEMKSLAVEITQYIETDAHMSSTIGTGADSPTKAQDEDARRYNNTPSSSGLAM